MTPDIERLARAARRRMMMVNDLDRLLRFDGLDTAERLTGESYKQDEATQALGLLLMMENNQRKTAALEAAGDTNGHDTLERYQAIILGAGFELAHEEIFESCREHGTDRFFIYAHRDGLLLAFDTFNNKRINGGTVWYNWRHDPELESRWGMTSSGGYENYDDPSLRVWVGSHDCREALLHNMQRLRDNGTLLSPWEFKHRTLWLAHYMDWKTTPESHHERVAEIERRTAERLRLCPQWVRDMILFDEDGQ